jgi:hypothetical protein
MRFTTLLHHVYNPDALRTAYFALKRDASHTFIGRRSAASVTRTSCQQSDAASSGA